MNCKKCNAPLNDGDMFCKNCGTRVVIDEMNNREEQNVEPNNQPMNSQSMNYEQPMNNQPMNYGPMYNNPNNYNQQYYQPPKSNNLAIFAIIGVVLVAAIAAVVIIVTKPFGNGSSSGESGSGSGSAVVQNNTYSVDYKGFRFQIPSDCLTENKTRYLAVGDYDNTWAGLLEVETIRYEEMKARKDMLNQEYIKNGYNATAAQIKTIAGVEVIVMEISKAGTEYVFAIGKLDATHCFGMSAFNASYTADYDVLAKGVAIAKSGKAVSASNSLSASENFSFTSIFETISK